MILRGLDSEAALREVAVKWAFGNAPVKVKAQIERWAAVKEVHSYLMTREVREVTLLLESTSVVKGLFNRVYRQDQWDWSTVSSTLGHPSTLTSKRIGSLLADLRGAIKAGDEEGATQATKFLERERALTFLGQYLDLHDLPRQEGDGEIYILSNREHPTLLKIGVTGRNAEDRMREINSATGVAFPFGIRKVWHVERAAEAERHIHKKLNDYRIRGDREFFRISFSEAVRVISGVLEENGNFLRCQGVIDRLILERGYGFLSDEDGTRFFFHASDCLEFQSLCVADRVSFLRRDTSKGPVACGLRLLEPREPS